MARAARLRQAAHQRVDDCPPGLLFKPPAVYRFAANINHSIDAQAAQHKDVLLPEAIRVQPRQVQRARRRAHERLHSMAMAVDARCLQEELPRAFWRMERQRVAADVVFIDPPYRMQDAYTKTLRALADSSLVWAMTVVIAEHEKKFDPGEEFGQLRRFRHLVQGSAALSFYRRASGADLRV